MYTPLHVHSEFSLLDGLSKPKNIAKRAIEIGLNSIALTDHGNVCGAIQFYKACKEKNIKPIFGCELYICKDSPTIKTKENRKTSHEVVLCKNIHGWHSLLKIINESNKPEHFYYRPRLNLELLRKYCQFGNIISFSGHLGSVLAAEITENDKLIDNWENIGVKKALELQDVFGKGNFYLEVQLIDSKINKFADTVGQAIRRIGEITNIPCVATPDAHYCKREDAVDQRVLLCTNLHTTFARVESAIEKEEEFGLSSFFRSDNYHIPTYEEMREFHTKEELENTIKISNSIEEFSILSKPNFPKFNCPNNLNADEYLRELCRIGWTKKIDKHIKKDKQGVYLDRIKEELRIIQGYHLSNYFLVVQDIVNYVRSINGLPGAGRGSCAGSLVSYLTGITSIDPIKYNLLFERFINEGRLSKDRISLPDIDIDVPIDMRERVIQMIYEKYGKNNVGHLLSLQTMKGRGAIKDVLRAYGNISFDEMNKITEFIPDEAKIAGELQDMKEETGKSSIIMWALENRSDKLKQWCYIGDNGSLQGPLAKRFEQAIRLEGTKSAQSKHAAGIIISDKNLSDSCPMIYDSKTDTQIVGFEMNDAEEAGLVKVDVLGICLLDKIMKIQTILRKTTLDV